MCDILEKSSVLEGDEELLGCLGGLYVAGGQLSGDPDSGVIRCPAGEFSNLLSSEESDDLPKTLICGFVGSRLFRGGSGVASISFRCLCVDMYVDIWLIGWVGNRYIGSWGCSGVGLLLALFSLGCPSSSSENDISRVVSLYSLSSIVGVGVDCLGGVFGLYPG